MKTTLKARLEKTIREHLTREKLLTPTPETVCGDLFVWSETMPDVPQFWLLLREHPDTPQTVCLIPLDDVTLWQNIGDLELPYDLANGSWVARGSDCLWVSRSFLDTGKRVKRLP